MEFRKKCAHVFRTILGWFLIVQGSLWGVSGGICVIVALFGGVQFNSFGDRLLFFATSLVMTVGCLTILLLGLRLKNSDRKEKTVSPVKRKSSPAKQKETQQDRNEQRLQVEKEENPWTAYAGEITLQGVLNTFSIEEQQRFKNQTYQYSQDTGRAGLSPEIAAANRGMVLVNGSPVCPLSRLYVQ